MRLKNKFTLFITVISSAIYAQEVTNSDTILKKETKISFLDSIKKTFVIDEMASCVDSAWTNEMSVLNQYEEMVSDIAKMDLTQSVDYELPTELLKERLKKLDEKSPFNIEYNPGLENIIKSFLKNRKKSYERLMGISQYYFPMFEEALERHNIPLEIKYLAIVESALKPKARSRVGATGLWQFMYETGKQYGLKIDSYVDERSNELKASEAAATYMQKSYDVFGDWELVLASYNSGAGNVSKAIRRSGGQQNFWNIKKYLPKETQGYVPAFLATMYIFEYHKEHGIVPDKAIMNHFATDTIAVKHHLTFKQISDLIDIPIAELEYFNPEYKRNEIPYINGNPYFIRMPKSKIAIFASNEDKIYAYANYEETKREKPFERIAKNNDDSEKEFVTRTKYHKVRKGDNLSEIASRYDVTVSEIKKWNHLKGNKAPLGRNLKIVSTQRIAFKDKTTKVNDTVVSERQNNIIIQEPKTEVAQVKYEKKYKTEKVVVNKDVTKYHKVKRGDNLGEIASKYDVSVAELRKWNRIKGSNISPGDNLKIIRNEKVTTTVKKEIRVPITERTDVADADLKSAKVEKNKKEVLVDTTDKDMGYHVVSKGDNLYTISKANHVTVINLKKWNRDINFNNLKVGTKVMLSNENESDNEEIAEDNSEVKVTEHVVKKGEFLSTIAKKYGTTVEKIKEWNDLSGNSIKNGDKLIVSKGEVSKSKKAKNDSYAANKKAKDKLYSVRRGDTLSSISEKFPGVTIAQLKKWNNIKGERIKPGMKLKISG